MTRAEAIEKIKFLSDYSCNYYIGRENGIALDMALEALKEKPCKTAKWKQYWGKYLKCSSCDNITAFATPYCPWCGLEMEEENDDKRRSNQNTESEL